ncbi:uncharacterized protein YALI1_D22143g [Yarrowia lipolytica]|uniref:Uncharacterized protein n=1 Tax=Yarrowia lipolytica TaxID=4952 RepID=A0A1D8NF16_YARLL|nr:hypothetical protein YALI1_D22143g [Yarrowia lipolytica]
MNTNTRLITTQSDPAVHEHTIRNTMDCSDRGLEGAKHQSSRRSGREWRFYGVYRHLGISTQDWCLLGTQLREQILAPTHAPGWAEPQLFRSLGSSCFGDAPCLERAGFMGGQGLKPVTNCTSIVLVLVGVCRSVGIGRTVAICRFVDLSYCTVARWVPPH